MKKRFRVMMTIVPIATTIVVIGIYFSIQFVKNEQKGDIKLKIREDTPPTNTNHTNDEISKFKIFPKLNELDFYKYIIIFQGEPILNDRFISRVVQFVIEKIQISDGHIEWDYKYNDFKKQSISISFKWVANIQNRSYSRTYTFEISKSV